MNTNDTTTTNNNTNNTSKTIRLFYVISSYYKILYSGEPDAEGRGHQLAEPH